MSDDGEKTCPLCAEEMDLTDQQLKPCKCGYEICVWCWHHIMDMAEKEETEGRCPACRTPYDKERIVGMAANCKRVVAEINAEKKQKSQKAKTKSSAEARKHLSSVRVIQRNLVYIIGLPSNLCDESILERREYFGQYGKVLKVSISRPASAAAQQASNNNTFSVYITYAREEEAVRCIQAVHNFVLEGKSLRACFGTTKYCHAWLRNMTCSNPDCLYLHDIGSQEDSFTKDEIISAYTRSRVPQIASNNSQRRSGNVLPPPVDDFSSSGTVTGKQAVKSISNTALCHAKGSPPNSSAGKPTVLPAAASWGLRSPNCRTPAISAACSQTPVKQKVEMLNSTSLVCSMTASTKQSSAWHDNVVTTPKIPERRRTLLLNGMSRPSEPSKSGSVKDCWTVMSSEAITDAECASAPSAWNDDVIVTSKNSDPFKSVDDKECRTSGSDLSPDDPLDAPHTSRNSSSCLSRLLASAVEDKGRDITLAGSDTKSTNNPSPRGTDGQSSSADKAAKGSVTVNENVESLCSGLSSVSIDDHLGLGQSNKDQHQASKSSLSSRPQQFEPKHGVEHLSSEPPSRALLVPDAHISIELFDWDLEPQKQGSMSQGIEREDDDDNEPSCSSYLNHPHNGANQSSYSSWNNGAGINQPLCTGNRETMERKVDTTSFLSRDQSAPCNGHKEDELSSFSKSGKVFESPDMNRSEERVKSLGKTDDEATSNKTASVDIGESSIISDILSLDFDPWDDSSSANNFSKLLGETEKQDGSFKLSSSRRLQNSNQSRFSFARQESQASDLEASLRGSGVAQKLLSSLQDSFGDGFQSGFQCNNFEGPNAVFNSNPAISSDRLGVSRAKISAPPGFSAPSRSPPPGFSSQDRFNQAYDITYSDNHLLSSSSLGNQYQAHPTGNPDDVEFIDPAILAVGKGRMPLGVDSLGLSSKSAFPSQFSTSDVDPRFQLLMQQSISSHQNLRIPDHIGDRFLPLSDAYFTSQLLAQNHGSLSPFAQMSLQPPRSMHISNGQWGGWNDVRNGSEMGMPEILRNERFGLSNFYSGNEEHKYHIPSSGDLYNRAFGL